VNTRNLELGVVGETLLSLLPVDHVPDGVHILIIFSITLSKESEIAYVSLDVEILKVKGVLPDINTNNWRE
jgi:hypothetical protein